MANLMTCVSFLLLGLLYLGVAINATLLGIVLLITAALWVLPFAGVALPTVPTWKR